MRRCIAECELEENSTPTRVFRRWQAFSDRFDGLTSRLVGGLQQHAQAAAQRIAAQHAQEADIAEQQLQSLEQDWQEALPFSVGLAQPVTESELQWYVRVHPAGKTICWDCIRSGCL